MSSMIECDSCKKKMYADSRSAKGDYHEFWLDRSDQYHICRNCYENLMKNFFHLRWNSDDDQWEEIENGD